MKIKLLFSTATIFILMALFSSLVDFQERAMVQAAVAFPEAKTQVTEPVPTSQAAQVEMSEEPTEEEGGSRWFITSESSIWQAEEMDQVQQVLENTMMALAQAGINGESTLDGYRFRRFAGEYVDGATGRIGVVDHNKKEIALSDTAFLRMGGFYIYHELGHAVDFRLDRRLSEGFHAQAGSALGGQGVEWQTAEGFWLRQHGYDDREEATADAFALWIMGESGNTFKPVFPGTPVDTEYEAIARFANEALVEIVETGDAG